MITGGLASSLQRPSIRIFPIDGQSSISNTCVIKISQRDMDFAMQNKNILIVEDELVLMLLYIEYCEMLGLVVSTACNGEEAWRLLQTTPGKFDYIITDYFMPKMTGAELIGKLRSQEVNASIILMSGRMSLVDQDVLDDNRVGLLHKPFTLSQLTQELTRLKDQAGANC